MSNIISSASNITNPRNVPLVTFRDFGPHGHSNRVGDVEERFDFCGGSVLDWLETWGIVNDDTNPIHEYYVCAFVSLMRMYEDSGHYLFEGPGEAHVINSHIGLIKGKLDILVDELFRGFFRTTVTAVWTSNPAMANALIDEALAASREGARTAAVDAAERARAANRLLGIYENAEARLRETGDQA